MAQEYSVRAWLEKPPCLDRTPVYVLNIVDIASGMLFALKPDMPRSFATRSSRLASTLFALLTVAACGAEQSEPLAPSEGKADGFGTCVTGQDCLDIKSYEVAFTNPICATYEYAQPVANARNTGVITAKPQNVFCTKADSEPSASRPESPQFRLRELVDSTAAGDELFLSYLSFSDQVIATALCEAAQRGVDVKFVLDSNNTRADELRACGADVMIRGHLGSIGYQHTKLVMVNPHGAPSAGGDPDSAVLALVNDPSVGFDELDLDAGLNATAAANIIAHRDGPDAQ